MGNKTLKPSVHLEAFLDYIDQIKAEYEASYDAVGKEDKRLQDLLHELEFAENKAEKGKVSTKLRNSRINRRKNKDIVVLYEEIVKFFEVPRHKEELKQLQQLIERQKKEEDYIYGERVYKPRKEATNGHTN